MQSGISQFLKYFSANVFEEKFPIIKGEGHSVEWGNRSCFAVNDIEAFKHIFLILPNFMFILLFCTQL